MTRTPYLLALVLAALAIFVAACGGDEEPATGSGSEPTATASADTSGQIVNNPDNAKTSLTIGSKSFTEQRVLGEIYAQGLAAAGYTTKTDLNLADEQAAMSALEGGQISAYPEYTGTALLVFFKKDAADLPKDPQAAYEEVKTGFEGEGITAFPPTPFTSSNEVAVTKETADKLQPQEHLRPVRARRGADAVRHARVPPAHGLPARPGADLRPEVQEVRAGRGRPAPRGAAVRPRGRLDRLHHRSADQAQRARSCSRTTRACSRRTTRRC